MCYSIISSLFHLSAVLMHLSVIARKKMGINRRRGSPLAAGLSPSIVLQLNMYLEINDYHLLENFFSFVQHPSEWSASNFTFIWKSIYSRSRTENDESNCRRTSLRSGEGGCGGSTLLKRDQIQVFTADFTNTPPPPPLTLLTQKVALGLFVLGFASANTPSLLK